MTHHHVKFWVIVAAVYFLSYIHWSFLINIDDTGGKIFTSCTQASTGGVTELYISPLKPNWMIVFTFVYKLFLLIWCIYFCRSGFLLFLLIGNCGYLSSFLTFGLSHSNSRLEWYKWRYTFFRAPRQDMWDIVKLQTEDCLTASWHIRHLWGAKSLTQCMGFSVGIVSLPLDVSQLEKILEV